MKTRRDILALIGAAGLTPVAAFAAPMLGDPALADPERAPAFVAARQNADGRHAAVVLNAAGEDLFTEELAGRGHDAAIAPDGRLAVMFARRPGTFAVVLDLRAGRRAAAFSAPEGRHFYGHGFFTPDGRLLYATENDYDGERGVIGIYDTATWGRIGEVETGGIGPHEAILMADGRTVAIANGGILTHPDYPRMKLNLADMAPSLSYLDLVTGDILETAALPAAYHQLSIRHLTAAGDGSIWFGGQYEGAASDVVPLIGRHQPGRAIEIIAAPDHYAGMNNYIGSVATSADGALIAASSPRGGQVMVFDAATRALVATRRAPDVCGLAPAGRDFVASDGAGHVWDANGHRATSPGAWDNHIAAIRSV
ncbi:DUF1513 domain-containing protein [Acuticoccus yangtzensis]|uniref:DUF1513 domain-containing protein n=1 Tax=Acuticoccus yangtzensis TaxID=1443441 RepID=UPI0009499F13|nr:DUF1513 domain-containing protein [Acuticoccus yangtzensis]